MVKKSPPKTNAEGYQLVLSHFATDEFERGKIPLAKALGVSRQIVHRWESHGIPLKYRTQLCEITKLKPRQIWPELFA